MKVYGRGSFHYERRYLVILFEIVPGIVFSCSFVYNLLLDQPMVPFGYDCVNTVTTFRNFANGLHNYCWLSNICIQILFYIGILKYVKMNAYLRWLPYSLRLYDSLFTILLAVF